jgi:transcriptional regulator with GAF, ATPase, and Fis domain
MARGVHNPTTAAMQQYGTQASPDGRGSRAGLVLLYAPDFEHFLPAYLLSERDLVIGREDTAGVCIPEGAVSRQHARIRFEGTRWVLADLGSRNGTLVDGQFVREVPLEDLHEIRIGDAIFKFVPAEAELYADYRIDGHILKRDDVEVREVVGGYQIRRLLRATDRVARSNISVVLLGESGTGKEVFAREIHTISGRRGPFGALNCAALPATLLESELFGYKRGAFSGADRDKVGLVRAADGGTLFLDEIGDMPLDAQAKLLRVLQSKEIIPVGATAPEPVDVRVVCATHRNLAELQQQNRFRGDLYARLNEYSIVLPPLRERKEDVYALAKAFLKRNGRPEVEMSFPFMTGLLHYDWPFNVRELEAAIKRGLALAESSRLDAEHLPDPIKDLMRSYGQRDAPPPTTSGTFEPLPPVVQKPTPSEGELRALLEQHRGNVAAVGREFGKERMQVHRWMKRYRINIDDYR